VGIAGEAVARGTTLNVDASDTFWFDARRHTNYHGSGLAVRSELVVPLLDTSQKCLGAIKCLNKQDAGAFSQEDVQYVTEAAYHIGMMLEGPDAGLRRVLRLSRRQMQRKDVVNDSDSHQSAVLCFLEKAQGLPRSAEKPSVIDPYITLSLVPGNLLTSGSQQRDMPQKLRKARNKDRKHNIRRFAKSNTILQDADQLDAHWEESIVVALPTKFEGVSVEELFVHVLLWDYHALKQDDVVAQAVVPLAGMLRSGAKVQEVKLVHIPGQENAYDLQDTRIWASFAAMGAGA